MKKNLDSEIIMGVTYKQVRDAFKGIGFAGFNEENFTLNLLIDDLKECYLKLYDVGSSKKEIKYFLMNYIRNKNYPIMEKIDLSDLLEKSKHVLIKLVQDEMVIKDGDGSYYLTELGHSLRMQKNLKPIPLKRAEALLVKLISSVKSFNERSDTAYNIDEVYVYGSTHHQKEMVGDVDIAFQYSTNYLEGEDRKLWEKRICSTFSINMHDIWRGNIPDGMNKALNVSPYISKSNVDDLNALMQKGATASLLYARFDIDKTSFPTLCSYQFKHNLNKVIQDIEYPM